MHVSALSPTLPGPPAPGFDGHACQSAQQLAATAEPVCSFALQLPKWNESCPEEGIPAVLPSDTVK